MILSLALASLINVFAVESPSYAKEMVAAAHELGARYSELHFTICTTEQVVDMKTEDLKQSLEQASVIVFGRVYGDVATKIHEAFPTGVIVFFARDRYYRRRSSKPIQLTLKAD